VPKTEYIESVVKEPVVECIHKEVEKCHYTYVTQFTPLQVSPTSGANPKNAYIVCFENKNIFFYFDKTI
jgi:hypothetical protein